MQAMKGNWRALMGSILIGISPKVLELGKGASWDQLITPFFIFGVLGVVGAVLSAGKWVNFPTK